MQDVAYKERLRWFDVTDTNLTTNVKHFLNAAQFTKIPDSNSLYSIVGLSEGFFTSQNFHTLADVTFFVDTLINLNRNQLEALKACKEWCGVVTLEELIETCELSHKGKHECHRDFVLSEWEHLSIDPTIQNYFDFCKFWNDIENDFHVYNNHYFSKNY